MIKLTACVFLFALLNTGATISHHGDELTLSDRFEILEAQRNLDLARQNHELAKLRYSAARSGQAKKGEGLSFLMNPGSHKRWKEAVQSAEQEVTSTEAELQKASTTFSEIAKKRCPQAGDISACNDF